jgi:hypothetical protein
MQMLGPNGLERHWSVKELMQKTSVEIPVYSPGFYRLSAAGADGILHPLERDSFVANVNNQESDPRKASLYSRSQLKPTMAARAKRRVELWHDFGGIILLFVLLEAFLIRRH